MKNSPLVSKTDWRSDRKGAEKTLHQNNRQRMTIATYGNQTHVNSLEGYYATTTPTMLTSRVVIIQWETVLLCQNLIDDRRKKCREKTLHQNNRQWFTIAWYGNRTHVNNLEGYYATTTPTMLTWTLVNIQGVTVLFCEKLIDDRTAKCRERMLHQNNRQRITIASYRKRTHVNSLEGYYDTTTPRILTWTFVILQEKHSLHAKNWLKIGEKNCRENAASKQSLTDQNCIVQESNPSRKLGKLVCYHYTNDPHMKICDYTMRNSPLVSKTDGRSGRKSAERKRCTKTIANGWQLHRTGIKPSSIAWKATMLPLHQRCSH